MKEELEKLRTEFNERIDALLKPKIQFEKGKWYKRLDGLMCFQEYKTISELKCFAGFGIAGLSWFDNGTTWGFNISDWTPATPEEVKQALVKEAERKYKITDKIISVVFDTSAGFRPEGSTIYNYEDDTLMWNGSYVYKQGQWAEIIPQEEVIKIGGYCVNFRNGTTTIDTYEFTKEFWQAAKVVAEHSKAAVWVGCDAKTICRTASHKWPVTLETIQKILAKL